MRVQFFRARDVVAICTKWQKMNYRPEIDGLRAVAVLPVILFHAGFSVFSGGYVGVDVFFVISGFLITSILIAQLQQGSFSIARFYERRARRILPALFVVMLACMPFAYMWMVPSQLEDFSASIVATVLSLSNFYFLSQVDYFTPDADFQPLLHTWSLAIEEQYYFLFPLMLLAMRKLNFKKTAFFILFLVVLSFIFSEWAGRQNATRSFFFTFSRFWEIGVGSICAFLTVGKAQRSSNALSALGLTMILFAIFWYDKGTPFPSIYALVPVVGTAFIILFAAEGTWVARLLSSRGFVGIGLISYSAYLWHQPLFAFARLRTITEPSAILMGVLAVASLLLAWATWYWVEQAFRRRTNPLLVTQRSVFVMSCAVGAVFVAVGVSGHVSKGFDWRFDVNQIQILMRGQPVGFGCEDLEDCMLGDAKGTFSGVAFVGDSHMGRYAYLLNEEMAARSLSARLLAKGWCAPLLYWRPSATGRCGGVDAENFEQSFLEVLSDDEVDTVVLAAQWANYTTGYRYNSDAISYDFALDASTNTLVAENVRNFQLALEATIARLREAGKIVVIVGPVPEYSFDVANVAFRMSMLGSLDYSRFFLSREDYDRRNIDVFRVFGLSGMESVYVDVWSVICDMHKCSPFTEDGFPLYSDHNHLVREGMESIVAEIMRRVM